MARMLLVGILFLSGCCYSQQTHFRIRTITCEIEFNSHSTSEKKTQFAEDHMTCGG